MTLIIGLFLYVLSGAICLPVIRVLFFYEEHYWRPKADPFTLEALIMIFSAIPVVNIVLAVKCAYERHLYISNQKAAKKYHVDLTDQERAAIDQDIKKLKIDWFKP